MKNMKLAWNPHDTAKWKRGTANDVAKHHPPNGAAKWHYQMTWPFQMRFRATITQLSTNASTIHPAISSRLHRSPPRQRLNEELLTAAFFFWRRTHTRAKSQTHQWHIQWTVIDVICAKCPLPTPSWVPKPKDSSSVGCPHTKLIVPNEGGADSLPSLLVPLILLFKCKLPDGMHKRFFAATAASSIYMASN